MALASGTMFKLRPRDKANGSSANGPNGSVRLKNLTLVVMARKVLVQSQPNRELVRKATCVEDKLNGDKIWQRAWLASLLL